MMKAKAFAPTNLALIKYWGKENKALRIPANSNLSICLSKIGTETEVEFLESLKNDEVVINREISQGREKDRVERHLNRIRKIAKIDLKAKVVSRNNFPKSAGLSSSASGLAALSLAASKAVDLDLSEKDLSRLARLGSGSACRSIPDGWVEWVKGDSDESSYAKQIFKENYWDLRVLVVILSKEKKKYVTTDGHKVAETSEFYKTRLKKVDERMDRLKKAIKEKNFSRMGELTEEDSLNMHGVMITSKPSLIYWLPETVRVMRAVKRWREQGLESYFSINTGQNVFVICKPKDENKLVDELSNLEGVIEVRRDRIGKGARLLS